MTDEKTAQTTPAQTTPEQSAAERPYVVSPGVYKRLTTGLGGFTLAIASSLLLVGAIMLITPRSDTEVLPTVDYQTHLWGMRSGATYTVHAPEGLPAGWRPTSSRITGIGDGGPVAWHLGFVTPDDHYAALEQSDEAPAEFVPRMTNQKKATGSRTVAGATWQEFYRRDKDQRSLARTLPGVTIVVTGKASYEELVVLIESLREQPRVGTGPAPAQKS